jgi:hypothetical protein
VSLDLTDPAPTSGPDASEVCAGQDLAIAVVVEKLRAGKPVPLRITGHSMYPFLVPGEWVLIEPCATESLRPGDLIAFERDGRLILHRLLCVGAENVVEKGDNGLQEGVVEQGKILGRATAVLGRRKIRLTQRHQILAGRWLAGLSAWHAFVYRRPASRIRAIQPLARGFTLLVRLAGALTRRLG